MQNKEVFGKKRIFFFAFALIILTTSALAADVAYIYKSQGRIDQNVLSVFNELGLSVELIKETNLPKNFSQYRFIYVGDERFRNADKIPINKKSSIISNYYFGELWGLTDVDGISQLVANSPLSVRKGSQIIQVYTRAQEFGGLAIPYYYLDDLNKAPGMQKVAGTYTGNSFVLGDVISYANAGTHLINGKFTEGKLCFFGIVKSDDWTPAARNMFKDCVAFVSNVCDSDAQCPGSSETQPFCSGNNIVKTISSFSCQNPGKVNAMCVEAQNTTIIENCPFGCLNGQCLPGTHDVSLLDFTNAIDKIKIEDEQGNIASTFQCNNKYKIIIKAKNSGNFSENVTFFGSIDSLSFSHEKIDNFAPKDTSEKTRTFNFTLAEGFYNISVEAIIPIDDNPQDNQAKRQIFVSCAQPPIACDENLDCGAPTESSPFCTANNITKTIITPTCNNSGSTSSFCTNITSQEIIQQCPSACSNGQCVNIECFTNSDCGINGFIGNPFCTANNVTQNFKSFLCNNPGTPQSFCSDSTSPKTIEQCSDICIQGQCKTITCSTNADCNDNNPLTLDACINPGTTASECRNTPINCNNNLDCGTFGFVGNEFCSEDDVLKNFQNATCISPGTTSSFCTLEITSHLVHECQYACIPNGICVRCDENLDCNDNNPLTSDICLSPGTQESRCQNTPTTPACDDNLDCGISGPIGSPFCTQNNVTKQFINYTCNAPGTANAFCSNSTSLQLIESCPNQCSSGACLPPICGNHLLESGEQCDDGNVINGDGCSSACQFEINCFQDSDCGFTGFIGNEFCIENNATKNFQNSTCINPGTPNSFCKIETTSKTINQCEFACFDGGICIRCDENPDCTDQNANTTDICHNPGLPSSFCENKPVSICGNSIIEPGEQCDDGNIDAADTYYTSNSSDNDGTCVIDATRSYQCKNNICGDGYLNTISEQCDDNNIISGDGCSSTCQLEHIICDENSDCGQVTTSNPFCSNSSIIINITTPTCINPGTPLSFCTNITSQNITSCPFSCENSQCIPEGIHDVALLDFSGSIGKIRLEEQNNNTAISGNQLMCNNKYKIIIKAKNQGNFTENVTFNGSVGSLSFEHVAIANFAPQDTTEKTRTVNFTLPAGFFNISIEAIIPIDNNPANNHAQREIEIICPSGPICGNRIVEPPEICDGNNRSCITNNYLGLESCTSQCTFGPCIPTEFCGDEIINGNEQCEDGNTISGDGCSSSCLIEPINCFQDSDCGIDGPISPPFCTNQTIKQNFINYTCNNPGTTLSFCTSEVTSKIIESCSLEQEVLKLLGTNSYLNGDGLFIPFNQSGILGPPPNGFGQVRPPVLRLENQGDAVFGDISFFMKFNLPNEDNINIDNSRLSLTFKDLDFFPDPMPRAELRESAKIMLIADGPAFPEEPAGFIIPAGSPSISLDETNYKNFQKNPTTNTNNKVLEYHLPLNAFSGNTQAIINDINQDSEFTLYITLSANVITTADNPPSRVYFNTPEALTSNDITFEITKTSDLCQELCLLP